MVVDGIGGEVCFIVDFDANLGTQMVPINDCDPWEADKVTKEETAAIDLVISSAKSEHFRKADAVGVHCTSVTDRNVNRTCGVQIPITVEMAASTCLGTEIGGGGCSGGSPMSPGSESDLEWIPICKNELDSGFDHGAGQWGVSSGDSNSDAQESTDVLLTQLGFYTEGPRTQAEEEFAKRYADANWHAKTWNLLPRIPFLGPPPGPRKTDG
jgi:hypothetical protein